MPQVTTRNSNLHLISKRTGGDLPVSNGMYDSQVFTYTVPCFYECLEKSCGNKPDFHQIVRFVAGVQKEPDFLHEVVDARLSPRAPDIHHPLMSRLIVLLPLIWGNIPNSKKTNKKYPRKTSG